MCPGCGVLHAINVGEARGPRWTFNDDPDAPTFSPSVLLKTTKVNLSDHDFDALLDQFSGEELEEKLAPHRVPVVCHSFVTAGRIRFLNDCTHSLAGQTVDLPDLIG